MSALQLKNTSESDPRSYEVLQVKPRKNSEAPTGFICNCSSYFVTARISFTCMNDQC